MFVMTMHNNSDPWALCSYYTPTLTNSLCEVSELHIWDITNGHYVLITIVMSSAVYRTAWQLHGITISYYESDFA